MPPVAEPQPLTPSPGRAAPSTTVGIIGASGYTGQELQRLISCHPEMAPPVLMSARNRTGAEAKGSATGPSGIDPYDPERLRTLSCVFLCTPHGVSQTLAADALDRDCRVVDLSADFRLRDAALYAATYGAAHQSPELLDDAVYGLTERARARVADARLVANPGCYPTSVLLPLTPLVDAGLIDRDAPVVCDCKSGVSGAGATPTPSTVFGAVHENFRAYGVAGHRHAPEIRQESGLEEMLFVPHLLPVFRGILSTVYVRPARGATVADMREHLRERYEGEAFVRVLEEPEGQPELADVRLTNRCHIAVTEQSGHAVITSVIDNLLKGAAGQALQNMNLMLGFPEQEGLVPARSPAEIGT